MLIAPALRLLSYGDGGLQNSQRLAQYYTERVLRRNERRYDAALKAYGMMLPRQPDAYRTHASWIQNFFPEAVRRAMLEVRRWQEAKLEDFNRRLANAQKELHSPAT